jgi:gliding motility-associated-like protein
LFAPQTVLISIYFKVFMKNRKGNYYPTLFLTFKKVLQISFLGLFLFNTQNNVYGQCYSGTVNRHAGTYHSNMYIGAKKSTTTNSNARANVLVAWGEDMDLITSGTTGNLCVPTVISDSYYSGIPIEVRGATSTTSSDNIFVLRTEDNVTPSNSKIYLFGNGVLPASGFGGATLVNAASEFSAKLPTGVTMADIAFVQVSPVTLAIVTTTGNVYITGTTTTSVLYGDGSGLASDGNNWHKVLIAGGTTPLSGVTKLSLSAAGAMALSGNNMYFFGKNAYVSNATFEATVDKATLINGTSIMPTLTGESIVDVISLGDGSAKTNLYFLTSNGRVFANGGNANGELGNNSTVSTSTVQSSFTAVSFPSAVNTTTNPILKIDASTECKSISAIGAMDKDGNLYTWGDNAGNLIGGSAGNYTLPQKVNYAADPQTFVASQTVVPVTDFAVAGHFTVAFDIVNDAYWYLGHFKNASMGAAGTNPTSTTNPKKLFCVDDLNMLNFFKVANTSVDFGFNCSNALPNSIVSTTNLLGFTACAGVASANKTFTLDATNLVADLVITAPTGYELCLTAGGTFTTSLTISPVSGAVTNKVIYVRLASTATNGASGNIRLTSTNAADIDVSTGTAVINSAPAITTQPIALTQNLSQGATPTNLSVVATGGGLTYQWFSNTTNTSTGGTLLSGATSATYTPLTTSAGTLYYYVVVSGTCSPAVTSSVSGNVVVTLSATTQAPFLISPASNSSNPTTFQINYTLPETPSAGTVRLTFTPPAGGTPIVWTMDNTTSQSFTYVIGSNPTTITNVVLGAALPFTTYNITLSYQNANGDPAGIVTNTNVQTLAPPNISLSQSIYSGVSNSNITAITPQNTGGIGTFDILPSLPNGLNINTVTGEISGRPIVQLATTSFTITATNAAGTSSVNFTLSIDLDSDGDTIPDTTDPDDDNDGLMDYQEQDCSASTSVSSTLNPTNFNYVVWDSYSAGVLHGTITIGSTVVNVTTTNSRGSIIDFGMAPYCGTTYWSPAPSGNGGVNSFRSYTEGEHKFVFDQPINNPRFFISSLNKILDVSIPGTLLKTNNKFTGTPVNATTTVLPGNEACGTISFNGNVTEVSFTGREREYYCDFSVGVAGLLDSNSCVDIDSDNDGTPNRLDVESDGDGVLDATEKVDGTDEKDLCKLVVANQTVTTSAAWNTADCDNDGATNAEELADLTDLFNPDSDGDGVKDGEEKTDGTDGTDFCDFVLAHQRVATSTAWNAADCDGDGVTNRQEILNNTDPLAGDTDGDGVLDNREIIDGTSKTDACDFVVANRTVTPNAAWNTIDCDNDGITNALEELVDTDGDGTPDFRDLDSDGDGITDAQEKGAGTTPVDTDNDGTPDFRDLDSDNDGLTDAQEKGTGTTSVDTDNDGTPDFRDLDSDNDGKTDALEKGSGTSPLDTDGDGTPDFRDLDADGDGIADSLDNCPLVANVDQLDNDKDGIGDVCDDDDDNDGVLDTVDNCPNTSNANQADRDRDGQGDVCDLVELNISQAITQNGDGVNDTWVIHNIENHPGTIVRVFNRWGNQVFYSNNYHNDWDGHYKDLKEGLPTTGAYLYQIDLNGDGSIDAQGWLYITN